MRGKEAIEALSRLVFWAFDRATATKNAAKQPIADETDEALIAKFLEEACEFAEAYRALGTDCGDVMREGGDVAFTLGELMRRAELLDGVPGEVAR